MNRHSLWFLLSFIFLGTLFYCLVHPTSPVLLTRYGPLKVYSISRACLSQGLTLCRFPREDWASAFFKKQGSLCPFKVWESVKEYKSPKPANHSLYQTKLLPNLCNPAGKFGGNQLLDGSMGLSPLYSNLTSNLHVSIATNFHQSFLWLHSPQV